MLIRPSSVFVEDLSKKRPFSKERYGSVKRVFIVCTEDKAILLDFQWWQIETIGVDEVKHMAMLSKPHDLSKYLIEIANTYA